jgi:putative ABC transport system permease protein
VPFVKGNAGFYFTHVAGAGDVARVSREIDDMFHNSPQPTKTESEKAFQLSFIATLGNVKAFILSICGAVVFAILLVSANTMAMSIRERTREVAMLKTLGFTRRRVFTLFVGEAVALSLAAGILGIATAAVFVQMLSRAQSIGVPTHMAVTLSTMLLALLVAAVVGFASASLPAYHASRLNIVEGLRHIG